MADFTLRFSSSDGESPIATDKLQTATNFQTYFQALKQGLKAVTLECDAATVAASATVTVDVSGIDVDDTVTINGVALTAKSAEDVDAGQFNISGTDDEGAESLAACINGSSNALINKHVTATVSGAVVTLTAKVKGHAGNAVTLASSDADGLAVSGARLTGGTATQTSLSY